VAESQGFVEMSTANPATHADLGRTPDGDGKVYELLEGRRVRGGQDPGLPFWSGAPSHRSYQASA